MASRLTAVLVILFCSRLAMSQDLPVNADALEIRNWPPVLISGTGQLGIAVSSARYKKDVRDMADASDRLLELRPVTFRYKDHPDDPTQFGLIAEEVEKILPELVFHDAAGKPETVLYQELPAMLLNEVQKQQRKIEEQEKAIELLQKRLESLETRRSDSSGY